MSQAPKLTYQQIAEVLCRVTQRCMAGKPPDDQLLLWVDAAIANLLPVRDRDWVRNVLQAEFSRADTEAPDRRKWIATGWRDVQPKESAMLLSRSADPDRLPAGEPVADATPVLSKTYSPDLPDRQGSRGARLPTAVEPAGLTREPVELALIREDRHDGK